MVWRAPGLPNPRVFFDVAVGGRDAGRVTFELFADDLPITAENFRCLCTGETGLGYWLRPRWYKHTRFMRVIPGFMCHGGDFNYGTGHMGESIYGRFFRNERFLYKHSKRGVLSMATSRVPHSNNSQFFITFAPTPWLDGRHVAFGQVESGWHVLDAIEEVGTEGGKIRKPVEIFQCGELVPDSFRTLSEPERLAELRRIAEFESLAARGASVEVPMLVPPKDGFVALERPEKDETQPVREPIIPDEVRRRFHDQ
eukprot:GDKH01000933.1.p1 GENE.GDKH01000933.1~~GDKH01000933.1.p1  ORF type:complete len:255 (-),score=16.43 GDKH01000933.1:60-824(-)